MYISDKVTELLVLNKKKIPKKLRGPKLPPAPARVSPSIVTFSSIHPDKSPHDRTQSVFPDREYVLHHMVLRMVVYQSWFEK